jgi:glutamine amidotransferase
MIHIIDYGLGNIQAFINTYKRLGVDVVRASSRADLQEVSKLILPGVGAFDHAMDLLEASGMRKSLERLVMYDKVPVLGICVGMQILADSSEEGVKPGLGWVKGQARSFAGNADSAALPMPHMGWNDVTPVGGSTLSLFRGLENNARFYFLHSYFFDCANRAHASALCDYGFQFACAVENGNVFGVQFHPEKSHHYGATLLRNFSDL